MRQKPDDRTKPVRALIYARVSSTAQLNKGDGLNSQETRCREYARMRGYEVEKAFFEQGVSGSVAIRPAMQALLDHVNASKDDVEYVLVIDDISRLARDLQTHLELRLAIARTGARLESPSMEFGDDPDAILIENLLAAVAQHFRQKNAQQTKHRMRARMLNGYYTFIACIGFKYEHRPGEGKILVRDEPIATYIQEGMEGLASGRFRSMAEVKRFWESCPEFPKDQNGQVRNQFVKDILTKVIYAGYVEREDWGVSLRKGRHTGMVSLETFERVQDVLNGRAYMPARTDVNSEFPLRGGVCCAGCGKLLTAYQATSKSGKKHSYYECFNKACDQRRKTIRKDQIEGEFAELLQHLIPSRGLLDAAASMFRQIWDERSTQAKDIAKSYRQEITKIERKIEALMDRLVDASDQSLVRAYERKISGLEKEKLILLEKGQSVGQPRGTFVQVFEHALEFLSNPYNLWVSGRLELQKMVLRLAFASPIPYDRQSGFRTPKTTLPFNALGENLMLENKMADTEGFEPSKRL